MNKVKLSEKKDVWKCPLPDSERCPHADERDELEVEIEKLKGMLNSLEQRFGSWGTFTGLDLIIEIEKESKRAELAESRLWIVNDGNVKSKRYIELLEKSLEGFHNNEEDYVAHSYLCSSCYENDNDCEWSDNFPRCFQLKQSLY